MKKLVITLSLAMTAGLVSAQIWSEDFDTNSPPSLINDGGADITNEYSTMQWTTDRASLTENGTLYMRVNNWGGQQGMTLGTSIALDDSLFTAAGTYRVTFDIDSMQADAILGVGVWDASIGSGGTNNYYTLQNYKWGRGTNNYARLEIKTTLGPNDATATLLAQDFFNSSHKGIRSVDFTYDGDGDVAIMLSAISLGSSANRWIQIDSISVDLATPNPDVPSFSSGSFDITPGAVQDVAYSNDTFVTSITDNPGFETLYYSAKTNLAPGLSVSIDGNISGTPTTGGTNTMIISVADADGAYDEAVFYLVVDDVNDPPVFNSPPAYGDNEFWVGNALVGYPYSADLNGYVTDPEGSELTFSGSGPGWLTVDPDGTFSGTPGTDDYLKNTFQVIASDGSLSSTGTMYMAVEKRNFIHLENFNTNAPPTVISTGLATFPGLGGASMTTTQTNGVWFRSSYGGSSEDLQFSRPVEGSGGMAGFAIAFDQALFVDGAATYQFRFTIEHIAGAAQIYYEVYDVDFGASGEVTADIYEGSSPFSVPDMIVTNGASATLLTSVQSSAGGSRTVTFDYDGSGDVLLRVCAGSQGPNDWWSFRFDNFKLLGPSLVTPLQTWAFDFDLKGADADAANDPNGDGWPLLYDYGLGLNPLDGTPDGGAQPTVEMAGSDMIYVHALRTNDPSLVYSIETNPNLTDPGGWSSGDYVTGVNVTTGAFNYVTNTIPATDPEMFIRLIIEE